MYTSAVDRYDATTGPFESDLSDRRGKTSGDLEHRTSTKICFKITSPTSSSHGNSVSIVPSSQSTQSWRAYPSEPAQGQTQLVSPTSKSRIYSAHFVDNERKSPSPVAKDIKNTSNSEAPDIGGILLGYWRDSSILDDAGKQAVIGIIDAADRLRMRIIAKTRKGEPLADGYRVPAGSGASWVKFDRIVFADHLVGLNYAQIKEYTRIRSQTVPEKTQEERIAAEVVAVNEAVRRVEASSFLNDPSEPVPTAYGTDSPDLPIELTRPGPSLKRPRPSNGFAATYPATTQWVSELTSSVRRPVGGQPNGLQIYSLAGTRPTGVLIGSWYRSGEAVAEDRHAVYGVVGPSNIFSIRVVPETRDGRFVGGNFPTQPNASWIPFQEVELEPHLKPLTQQEVKEYCEIRQYQLSRGESASERIANETRAIYEVYAMKYRKPHGTSTAPQPAALEAGAGASETNANIKPAKMLVDRNRTDRGVSTYENRAVCSFSKPEVVRRPTTGPTDVKMYDRSHRTKYERKASGPFAGKLVSQGTIINIDGEDYVEYRVLTRPLFV